MSTREWERSLRGWLVEVLRVGRGGGEKKEDGGVDVLV